LSHLSLPLQSAGDVAATTAATPIDLEESHRAKRCPEMQLSLSRRSLTIAFKQARTQSLDDNVSTGVFWPVVLTKFQQDISFL
jgi:hypothetical protein